MGIDPTIINKQQPPKQRPDYRLPIARSGEQQFAAIIRNRSGMDAGNLDFGLRSCEHLSEYEQQEMCDVAYSLYQAVCRQLGKRSRNDKENEHG